MVAPPQRPEIVSAMLDPDTYPRRPGSIELVETHISWVFLADELAYKVKKPLVLPFLDYGTVRRRRQMCAEEVRLNRRLAPEIYLGVVAIVRRGEGFEIAPEDEPNAADYAVEMRRVEADRSLAALAARGELEPTQVEAVATLLARFHAAAEAAPAHARDLGVLVDTLEENLTTLREVGVGVVGEPSLAAAERFTRAFLDRRGDGLAARAEAGLVRDCHGDLRAEHVIVPAAAGAYVYDCVEFNPALRWIDVGADLAFLVMDLARLGEASGAATLLDAYRRAGGDPGDDAQVSFFAAYRAWVRAKVACLRLSELDRSDPERERVEREARELVRLGRGLAWRARSPLVIAVCGVSGSGKSTLAGELAELSGWPRLVSDVVRKRLAGLAPSDRADPADYSDAFTERTYRELGVAARRALAEAGVIVDATFHRRAERDAFRAGLGDAPAPVHFVECEAPRELLHARVRRRGRDPDRVSDAGVEVVDRQLAEIEPPVEVPGSLRTAVATEAAPGVLAAEVEAALDAA